MIGKESLIALETLAKQQTRIYPDAADYGIWETPKIAREIKAALADLKTLEGGKATQWETGSSYRTRLAVEYGEGVEAHQIHGYVFEVARFVDQKTRKVFYTILIYRAVWRSHDAPIGTERPLS